MEEKINPYKCPKFQQPVAMNSYNQYSSLPSYTPRKIHADITHERTQ